MKENRERRITIRLRQSVYDEIKKEADTQDVSVSHVGRRVLTEHVKNPLARFVSPSTVKEDTPKKDAE